MQTPATIKLKYCHESKQGQSDSRTLRSHVFSLQAARTPTQNLNTNTRSTARKTPRGVSRDDPPSSLTQPSEDLTCPL